MNKGITKQPENFKNGSSKSITVTNYFNGNGLDSTQNPVNYEVSQLAVGNWQYSWP